MQTKEDGVVGYVLMGYPRISETFIANEIHLLETMGMRIRLFSVKSGGESKVNAVVSKIHAKPCYTPKVTSLSNTNLAAWLFRNGGKYVASHAHLLRSHPLRYLSTLGMAARMSWKYRSGFFAKPKKIYIKEFLQAGFIASLAVKENNIRHLHGHFCHGATSITWFVSRLTGIPFSFTAHAKDIYKPTLNPGNLLERKLNAAEFVTTCTGANVEHLNKLYPDYDRLHKIYHGLDTDYFTPPPPSVNSGALPLILSVGRFVKKKGFPNLINACVQLKEAGIRFQCRIVGEKGDTYDDELPLVKQMIDSLGLKKMVTLQDVITQEDLRVLYETSSIFVLPCQVSEDGDRDGIPNVLVEAMAMGIPVVSTPVSGIPELVEDKVNGLLVPPENSKALAGALKQLLEDQSVRAALISAGRDKVCRDFNSLETNRTLRDLFLKTMNGETARHPNGASPMAERTSADA